MPSDSASFLVGASWSPEMIAMCLIPRLRSPAMISFTSGRTAACSSIAPPSWSSTPTMTIVYPSTMRLLEGLAHFGRQLDPFHLHEPLAADPDRMPVDVDGDAVADLVLRVVGRRQDEVPALAALCRIARAIGW